MGALSGVTQVDAVHNNMRGKMDEQQNSSLYHPENEEYEMPHRMQRQIEGKSAKTEIAF